LYDKKPETNMETTRGTGGWCALGRISKTERAALVDTLGEAAMMDAAAVIAAFNAYPRIADATGIPLEDAKVAASATLRARLGLEAFNTQARWPYG
jgi:hypothetical protein